MAVWVPFGFQLDSLEKKGDPPNSKNRVVHTLERMQLCELPRTLFLIRFLVVKRHFNEKALNLAAFLTKNLFFLIVNWENYWSNMRADCKSW